MAGLSNSIEEFLIKMLDDNEGIVVVKRNELANDFNCSPSQINYVLETRFQTSMGYYIESRRGGGGYIKISRVEIDSLEDYLNNLINNIGNILTFNESINIIDSLVFLKYINEREAVIFKAAMEDRALDVKGQDKNILRANLFKNMLVAIFKEI